ncbi:hypothetical protein M3225_28540 [Priestia aryabhattai]|uniref:hypothetical protein n=1 Tax=Priestia aryabhattai TaxID=412384 RepID=UPI00203C57DD|nr:hypothetical protein [Priestia aryabhattai]MCM3774325.1 hypothetical protein [Priestia aryabhattai]
MGVFVGAIPKGLPFGRWWTASTVLKKKGIREGCLFSFWLRQTQGGIPTAHLVERAPNFIEDEKLV